MHRRVQRLTVLIPELPVSAGATAPITRPQRMLRFFETFRCSPAAVSAGRVRSVCALLTAHVSPLRFPVLRSAAVMLTLICWLALAGCATPPARTLPPAEVAAIDGAVRAEMERQRLVGVAVGIIHESEIAYLQGYGLADREAKAPVTPRTIMNWASNSKPMAAVLAMKLVDANRLDLQADVRTYVPEFPDKAVKITARDLLCHQSGIVHYANGVVLATKREYTAADPGMDPVLMLDKFNRSPLLYAPGEKTSYSSYAYVLLSAVVQRAAGRPYDELVRSQIARPLKMKSLQLDMPADQQPDWAAGYTRNRLGVIARASEEAHYWKFGAGGYKSDIGDFARWARGLMKGGLVSTAAQERMWAPQKLNDGKPTGYGLGFRVDRSAAGLAVSHGGKQEEATSFMIIEPEAGRGIVVLCNCGFADINALVKAVSCARAPAGEPAPAERLAAH